MVSVVARRAEFVGRMDRRRSRRERERERYTSE
jgi:hypothetical protein